MSEPCDATHYVKYSNGSITYFKKLKFGWCALVDGRHVALTRKPPNLKVLIKTMRIPRGCIW